MDGNDSSSHASSHNNNNGHDSLAASSVARQLTHQYNVLRAQHGHDHADRILRQAAENLQRQAAMAASARARHAVPPPPVPMQQQHQQQIEALQLQQQQQQQHQQQAALAFHLQQRPAGQTVASLLRHQPQQRPQYIQVVRNADGSLTTVPLVQQVQPQQQQMQRQKLVIKHPNGFMEIVEQLVPVGAPLAQAPMVLQGQSPMAAVTAAPNNAVGFFTQAQLAQLLQQQQQQQHLGPQSNLSTQQQQMQQNQQELQPNPRTWEDHDDQDHSVVEVDSASSDDGEEVVVVQASNHDNESKREDEDDEAMAGASSDDGQENCGSDNDDDSDVVFLESRPALMDSQKEGFAIATVASGSPAAAASHLLKNKSTTTTAATTSDKDKSTRAEAAERWMPQETRVKEFLVLDRRSDSMKKPPQCSALDRDEGSFCGPEWDNKRAQNESNEEWDKKLSRRPRSSKDSDHNEKDFSSTARSGKKSEATTKPGKLADESRTKSKPSDGAEAGGRSACPPEKFDQDHRREAAKKTDLVETAVLEPFCGKKDAIKKTVSATTRKQQQSQVQSPSTEDNNNQPNEGTQKLPPSSVEKRRFLFAGTKNISTGDSAPNLDEAIHPSELPPLLQKQDKADSLLIRVLRGEPRVSADGNTEAVSHSSEEPGNKEKDFSHSARSEKRLEAATKPGKHAGESNTKTTPCDGAAAARCAGSPCEVDSDKPEKVAKKAELALAAVRGSFCEEDSARKSVSATTRKQQQSQVHSPATDDSKKQTKEGTQRPFPSSGGKRRSLLGGTYTNNARNNAPSLYGAISPSALPPILPKEDKLVSLLVRVLRGEPDVSLDMVLENNATTVTLTKEQLISIQSRLRQSKRVGGTLVEPHDTPDREEELNQMIKELRTKMAILQTAKKTEVGRLQHKVYKLTNSKRKRTDDSNESSSGAAGGPEEEDDIPAQVRKREFLALPTGSDEALKTEIARLKAGLAAQKEAEAAREISLNEDLERRLAAMEAKHEKERKKWMEKLKAEKARGAKLVEAKKSEYERHLKAYMQSAFHSLKRIRRSQY